MKKYLRSGFEYYKLVTKPTPDGNSTEVLVKWKRQTIIDDHGKSELESIPKYDGFVVIPSHENYQKEIEGFYNKYSKIEYTKVKRSTNILDIPQSKSFLRHIFGDQLEIGLDYLSILWHKPTQILPILCLVSEDRSTGKTTFLNWLKLIFQNNMTFIKNEDLRSRFNNDWTDKLIVGVDEVLLDRKEDTERLKNLSTSKDYKTEAKGKDKVEDPFFGKFILCSNNETNFIFIDEKEIRFWVRKVPSLKGSDPNLIEKLNKELPWFIKFISQRKIQNPKISRMWFSTQKLKTQALNNLIKGTKFNKEKELIYILDELFEDYNVDELKYTSSDLQDILGKSKVAISPREIRQILVDKWKLEFNNSSYDIYYKTYLPSSKEWIVESTNKKGRHYTFKKQFIQSMLKS